MFHEKQIIYLKEENIMENEIIQFLSDKHNCKILNNNPDNNPHSISNIYNLAIYITITLTLFLKI